MRLRPAGRGDCHGKQNVKEPAGPHDRTDAATCGRARYKHSRHHRFRVCPRSSPGSIADGGRVHRDLVPLDYR